MCWTNTNIQIEYLFPSLGHSSYHSNDAIGKSMTRQNVTPVLVRENQISPTPRLTCHINTNVRSCNK